MSWYDFYDAADVITTFNKNRFHQSYQRYQPFSFPDSIIYYITKNPAKPEIYQKIVQTCKYFFIKNPILVLTKFSYCGEERSISMCHFLHDLENISSVKIWITHFMTVSFTMTASNMKKQHLLSSIIPKIYRCDVKLSFLQNQVLSYNEFCFLFSSTQHIDIEHGIIKQDDDSVVAFEKFIEALPKAKKIRLDSNVITFTPTTFQELLKVKHFLRVNDLSLTNIPETFNLEDFFTYMKINKHTKIFLKFLDTISEDYKQQLEGIFDRILETNRHDYKLPSIFCNGLDIEKLYQLYKLSY